MGFVLLVIRLYKVEGMCTGGAVSTQPAMDLADASRQGVSGRVSGGGYLATAAAIRVSVSSTKQRWYERPKTNRKMREREARA